VHVGGPRGGDSAQVKGDPHVAIKHVEKSYIFIFNIFFLRLSFYVLSILLGYRHNYDHEKICLRPDSLIYYTDKQKMYISPSDYHYSHTSRHNQSSVLQSTWQGFE
jgi:hypothetical protein